MEAYDESSGKMPLMYDVENFKTDASKGKWPVLADHERRKCFQTRTDDSDKMFKRREGFF